MRLLGLFILIVSLFGCSIDGSGGLEDNEAIHTDTAVHAVTDSNGTVRISSTKFDTEHDVQITDENGNPLGDLDFYYAEEFNNKIFSIKDPAENYAEALVVGTHDEINGKFAAKSVGRSNIGGVAEVNNLKIVITGNDVVEDRYTKSPVSYTGNFASNGKDGKCLKPADMFKYIYRSNWKIPVDYKTFPNTTNATHVYRKGWTGFSPDVIVRDIYSAYKFPDGLLDDVYFYTECYFSKPDVNAVFHPYTERCVVTRKHYQCAVLNKHNDSNDDDNNGNDDDGGDSGDSGDDNNDSDSDTPSKYSYDSKFKIIKDNHTGLMWHFPEGGFTIWEKANDLCGNLNVAGYDEWRLPSIYEISNFIDFEKFSTNYEISFSIFGFWLEKIYGVDSYSYRFDNLDPERPTGAGPYVRHIDKPTGYFSAIADMNKRSKTICVR